jgi:hypothetical protein
MFLRVLKTRHLEIIGQLEIRLGVALERLEVHNQGVFDGEHRVVVDVLARTVENLRYDGFVARCLELFQQSVQASHGENAYDLPRSEYVPVASDACPAPAV